MQGDHRRLGQSRPLRSQRRPLRSQRRSLRSQIWKIPWTTARLAARSLCCPSSKRTAARSTGAARGTMARAVDARRHLVNGQRCQGVSQAHLPHRKQPARTGLLRTCHSQLLQHRQAHLNVQAAVRPQLLHHRSCRSRRVLRQAHLAIRPRHRTQRNGSSSIRSAGPSSMRALHY